MRIGRVLGFALIRHAPVILLLTLAGSVPAAAQARPPQAPPSGGGEIRGVVVDAESRAPIASATIEVFNGGAAMVAGAITRNDGSFRIEGQQPGAYRVRVTMIGYASQSLDAMTITPAEPRANFGTIALTRHAIALQSVEVDVAGQVVIAPDRNIYRARDIASAAATATDVLENVPSVHVDADGKLSLRGNENLVVQINGRSTPIRGAELATYLKQLPASTIERVEVIPNPSARQDPEGMAGILNIVMKQTVDLGRSGDITLAGATSGRLAGSGNFGYQAGAITLFTTYGYSTDERDVSGINHRTRLGSERVPTWFTEQDVEGTSTNSGHNFSVNLENRVNRRDAVFATGMLNVRRNADNSLSAYTELDRDRAPVERYDRTRGTSRQTAMVDGAVGFRSLFKPQQHELSAEIRFNRQDDRDRTTLWRFPAAGTTGLDGELNDTDALTTQLTAQLDYMRMLGTATKLETGYRGNGRWLDRDYVVLTDEAGSGGWSPSDLSNELRLDEQVHAVYGVVSRDAGRVRLQAGLRAEHAHRDISLGGGQEYPFTYRSLYPSGLASMKLGDRSEAKLSYSRRVRRPGAQELNPFPVFFDTQNVFFGNPSVGPEYTDAIELGLQRSGRYGSVQLSPFYRRTTDVIRIDINTADTVRGREVTSISFRNLATSNSWGTDLNSQLRVSPRLSGMAGLNIFKVVTDGGSESAVSSDAVTWMARLNTSYIVSPATTLQGTYMYRAPMNVERGRFSGMSMLNVSVRQKLAGDRLTATMRMSDPFATSGMRLQVGDDNVLQLTRRAFNSRAIHLSLQATFGQAPRLRQPRPEDEPPPQTGFPASQ
jgi:ferric enterobactin receptor